MEKSLAEIGLPASIRTVGVNTSISAAFIITCSVALALIKRDQPALAHATLTMNDDFGLVADALLEKVKFLQRGICKRRSWVANVYAPGCPNCA